MFDFYDFNFNSFPPISFLAPDISLLKRRGAIFWTITEERLYYGSFLGTDNCKDGGGTIIGEGEYILSLAFLVTIKGINVSVCPIDSLLAYFYKSTTLLLYLESEIRSLEVLREL